MPHLKNYNDIALKTVLLKDDIIISDYDEIVSELVKKFLAIKNMNSTVYFIGNGGSAGVALHMTVDFLKNGRMRTHDMLNPTVLTCLGNDFGYEHVFSKQLEIVANPNDLLVAISSSGESANILNAVKVARAKFCQVVTLSVFKAGNSLTKLGVHVPSMNYGTVESIHNMILQDVVDSLKNFKQMGE